MKLLLVVLALGAIAGWCAARFAPEGVSSVLSVLVVALVLGIVPLGRLGRRVLVRSD